MANIRDIAKAASVSVSTVSRVLNDHPYVSDEKRKAVMEAVESLNFHKNLNAVHLSKGKTHVVGVVLPYIHQPFFSLILNGIAREASVTHSHIMLFQTNYEDDKEREALESLKGKQLDGLIVCSRTLPLSVIKSYSKHGPIVLCEETSDLQCVYIDHHSSILAGIEHLKQSGYRKIGLTLNRKSGTNTSQRVTAYKQACSEEFVFYNALNIEDGEEIVRCILENSSRPDALLVTNDYVAAGILNECRRNGVVVPDELALLSYDNQHLAESLEISSVELPLLEMGQEAFKLLSSEKPEKRELPFSLIHRKTT
ncbi:substrate-binding domain-containing protein [Fictibacillus aquaticus]|uniref:HTH lacI-type domain-containing protein n=1 Tax=Fictibacillus aquaticus TaxID=2021314 RepID=A0A235F5U4_9BACL|nr:substrate-binding domain-containing protein [Fictibacillus aquaticus]OYD56075.1 hypothetical protein CGZ90_19470 [Fictibacillus aquaticus]